MTAPKPRDELKRRPNGVGAEPMRSIRVGDEAWALIRQRADDVGLSVGAYLSRLAMDDARDALRGLGRKTSHVFPTTTSRSRR